MFNRRDQHGDESLRRERRTLRRVLLFTLPLFVIALLVVPSNINPLLRLYSIPSNAMAPTLRAGTWVAVNRLSYGMSRRTYDRLDLPMNGRWPAWSPKRGDIVVFRLPRDHKVHFIKRVVGLPGDKVQMKAGRLWINGQTVPREDAGMVPDTAYEDGKHLVPSHIEQLTEGISYTIIEAQGDKGPFDNTQEFVVPPGHYFMMGDNRDNSADSRMSGAQGVGFVPSELLIGKVVASF